VGHKSFSPITSNQASLKGPKKPTDTFIVHGHASPTAKFKDSSLHKIKTLYDPFTSPPPSSKLTLKFQGSPPFQALISSDSDVLQNLTNVYQLNPTITVTHPGTYRIDSVCDKYCKGSPRSILHPDSVQVVPVNPPELTLSSSPIEEACVGAIGFQVNLSFVGEPPFWVEYMTEMYELLSKKGKDAKGYQYEKQGRLIKQEVGSKMNLDKPRHSINFEPTEPGAYKYTFTHVR
jgi:hypothetical protein